MIDYAVKIRVGTHGVDLKNVKMSLNPFCEIAVEEAVKLKENNPTKISEVVALSIGPKQCQETLRTSLAMGCDRAIHVTTDRRGDYMELQSDAVAKIFQKIIEGKEPDVGIVFVGKQAIDSDCGQVGPMLAGYMGWPQATFAANVDILEGDTLSITRETDQGTEQIKVPQLPAVISCDLRLNTPRYATLPNIMKAKKKKIEKMNSEDLGVDLMPKNNVLEIFEPPPRKEGVIVDSVDVLVNKLKNEASVI